MRIQVVVAIADGLLNKINTLNKNLDLIPQGNIYAYKWDTLIFVYKNEIRHYIVTKVSPDLEDLKLASNATSKKWSLYLLTPISNLDDYGLDLQRALKKLSLDQPTAIANVWSLIEFQKEFSAVAAKMCIGDKGELRAPNIIWGDMDPEQSAKVNYCPTNEDCIQDVKPDMTLLFAPIAVTINDDSMAPK